ncbi:MAG: hypothetical protein KKA64_02635 [Nanoarchaeota archaeon]|nr:hypothetical protein [Nanoarchaeota archaeon]
MDIKIDTINQQSALIKAMFNTINLNEIPTNKFLNLIFHNLQLEFPEYFQKLNFDINSQEPKSKELEKILSSFQASGTLLSNGQKYKIKKEISYLDNLRKYIPDLDIFKLREIKQKFEEYILEK